MVFSCLCYCQSSEKSIFFVCNHRKNLLNLKESSDRLVIVVKGFLKLPNLHMPIKQESITLRKLGSSDFWRIACSALNNSKSAYIMVILYLLKENDSGISLPVFPSRTNLKLHNISVTPKMAKRS